MPRAKPLYYWDACIWIAWIMNEKRPNREMDGVHEIVEAADKNRVSIIVSELLTLEMLRGKWPPGGAQKFDDLFKRKNIKRVPITPNITNLSQQIRDFYVAKGEKTLSSNDAAHIATAINYEATQFHTFDDGQTDRRWRSLLALNGDVAGYPVTICKPPISQLRLF
jgi:predicted nucleic acid-binding protein